MLNRYANPGDASPRHTSYAGQCTSSVFFCVLHLWHHWCTVMGRRFKTQMFSRSECKLFNSVSIFTYLKHVLISISFFILSGGTQIL